MHSNILSIDPVDFSFRLIINKVKHETIEESQCQMAFSYDNHNILKQAFINFENVNKSKEDLQSDKNSPQNSTVNAPCQQY